MNVKELLQKMLQAGISDMHFKAGSPPILRVNGKLSPTPYEPFQAKGVEEFASSLMTDEQKARFKEDCELDLSYCVDGVSRFRVNVYRQKGTVALTLRVVPLQVHTFAELNMPAEALAKLAGEARGLVLFAGVTGSGKTTTLNSVIDHINRNSSCQIVTIEDPIEFYHTDVKSSIAQREVGPDTRSFKNALKYALRQDPDVIVIGEMRDFDAVSAALTAAETGHLVLSTIHTMDAVQTLDRIIDVFPAHQQAHVRVQLSNVLRGVVAQRLLPGKDGKGRWPAAEVLIVSSLVKKLIAEGKPQDIHKAMEQGQYYKMQTFDQDLLRLVREEKVALEEALEGASSPDDLALKARGIGSG